MKRDANTQKLTLDMMKRVKDEANLIHNEIVKKKRDFNQTTMNGFSKIKSDRLSS
jgi:hypothetical protein